MGNPYHKRGGVPEGGQFTNAIDAEAISDSMAGFAKEKAAEGVGQSLVDRISKIFKFGEDDEDFTGDPFAGGKSANVKPDDLSVIQAASIDGIASAIEDFSSSFPVATKVLIDGEMTVFLKETLGSPYSAGALGITAVSIGGNEPTRLGFSVGSRMAETLWDSGGLASLESMKSPVQFGVVNKLKAGDVLAAAKTLYYNATLHELSHAMDGSTNPVGAASEMLMGIAHKAAGSLGFGQKTPGPIKAWVAKRVSVYASQAQSPGQFKAELFAETMSASMIGAKVTPALRGFADLTKREWAGAQMEMFPKPGGSLMPQKGLIP